MVLQKSRAKMRRSNALLAGFTFLLVLYSTYLTRSGALEGASVHAFVTPGLASYLTAILAAGLALMLFTLARHYRSMRSEPLSEHLLSREVMFFTMAIIFAMLALLVGLGTSAPLFTSWFQDNPSLVDVGFYARTVGPLGLAIAFLMGLAPLVGWKGSRELPRGLAISAGAAVLTTLFGALLGMRRPFELLFLASVGLALGTNVLAFIRAYGRGGLARAGGYMAHLGATLIFLSLLAQTASEQVKVDLELKKPVSVMGFTMTFQGWQVPPPGSQQKQAAVVDVDLSGRTIRTYPRLYSVFGNGQWMTRTEPYIHRSPHQDLYIAPAQYEERTIADVGGAELELSRGESGTALGYTLTFEGFESSTEHMSDSGENTAFAVITASRDGRSQTVRPALTISAEGARANRAELDGLADGVRHVIMIDGINVDNGLVKLLLFDPDEYTADPAALGGILTLEVSTKPLMSLLWIGILIVVVGGFLSAWRRYRQSQGSH
jgi:cytochrome c-type biogenesis protein CcmF